MKRIKSQNDFISVAKIKHENIYDYSKVNYQNTKIKVAIICSQHGIFFQTPANHLKGQGCPTCGQIARTENQRYSKDEFINSVRKVHKNKYDYSKVDYINSQTKVIIVCPDHGDFLIKPNSHFNGQGCSKCGRLTIQKRLTLDYSDFLERAKKIHASKYVYDEKSYIKYTSKIKIYCSEHGVFEQTPHSHISMKTGCPICGKMKAGAANQKKWNIVLEMFKTVHGNFYNYDENSYIDATNPMNINCPKHGWFKQKPYQHYGGHGCKKCSSEENGLKKKVTFTQFLQKSIQIHGDKYNYRDSYFEDIFSPIKIECVKHGYFIQTPRNHYRGSGCPKCNSSKGESTIRQILTELNLEFEEQKTFDNLIWRNKLKCDFYLTKLNVVIEFNGLQHYEPISVFGGINGLKETQERDIVKYEFLKQKKIGLIIIRYDNSDIKEYLISKIQELSLTI